MAKEYARAFYKSKAWISCRKAYISQRTMIDGGMCERCHDKPGYILHHKISLTPQNINNPEITLNHCNLEYVCKDCHDNIHFNDIHNKTNRCIAMFDDNGQVIPFERNV